MLAGLELQGEHVVVLLDQAGGKRQGIAGLRHALQAPPQVRHVEVQLIQWRISQLEQELPAVLPLRRLVLQIQAQPEHRAGIAGVEYILVMPAETGLQRGRGDIGQRRIAAHILEHGNFAAERNLPGMLVEDDRASQLGPAEKQQG